MSRDLNEARKAYMEANIEMSKKAHSHGEHQSVPLKDSHSEAHNTGSDYIKSAVYGGLDGLINSFAIVTSAFAAGYSSAVVVALGISNLFGDGISMALGDYLSSKAETEFANSEKKREQWEVDNNIEGEKQEMVEIYESKGMSRDDAMKITNLISKNPQAFVDIMMAEELGITGGDEHPKINALVTFIAYVLFGFMPLLPYVVSVISGLTEQLFLISCILTGAFLFILGVTKSMFSYSKWYMQGGETLFTGGIAAALAYLIGWGFSLIAERN